MECEKKDRNDHLYSKMFVYFERYKIHRCKMIFQPLRSITKVLQESSIRYFVSRLIYSNIGYIAK